MSYSPILKKSQLIFGSGSEIICTGWMPVSSFQSALKKYIPNSDRAEDYYCSIGGLTSIERGIPILIQNMLASGNIQKIWLINDRLGENITANYALHLWASGEKELQLPKFIPGWALEKLKKNITFHFTESKEIIRLITNPDLKKNEFQDWLSEEEKEELKKLFIEENQKRQNQSTLPSDIYGHTISAQSETEAWLKILDRIIKFGRIKKTGYEGSIRELVGLKVTVKNPFSNIEELKIPEYVPCDLKSLKDYFPSVLNGDNFDPNASSYTYGERIFSKWGNQVSAIIEKLKKEPESQSAVISLWDNKWDNIKGKSPCLNHVWFSIYDNKLYANFTIRSNDMFSAWFSNVCAFRQLQLNVAQELNIEAGEISTFSLSAHIYDDCFDFAIKTIESHLPKEQFVTDPYGFFVVEEADRKNKTFLIALCDPISGLPVHYFEGKANRIIKEVEQKIPQIAAGNLLWLYKEMES